MRTTIATSLALGIGLALGGTAPALGQGAPNLVVPGVAGIIDYGQIGISVTRGGMPLTEELVLDGQGQGCTVDLVGTPPDEKTRLTCTDTVDAPTKPISKKRFDCQVFRGRRGGPNIFVITNNTSINVDNQGRVTMTCTAG